MKKKILIINPGIFFKYYRPEDYIAVSPTLILFFSYLKEHGIDCEPVDFDEEVKSLKIFSNTSLYRKKARELLKKHKWDIVGISCYSSRSYLHAVSIAQVCKELNKNCTVVVGGYHATTAPKDFYTKKDYFDFIVRGEGEIVFLQICQGSLKRNTANPQIIEGIPRDLSRGVFLDWKGYKYYQRDKGKDLRLSITRGCPHHCSFCVESKTKYINRQYPVSLAIRDLKNAIKQMEPRKIILSDPSFPLFTEWGEEFMKRLIKEKIKIPINMLLRIDAMKEKYVDLISKLDLILHFGIDSCSQRMLVIMNKTKDPRTYLKKVEQNLLLLNNRKILTIVSLIFNHPGDTNEIANETVDFLTKIFVRCKTTSTFFHFHPFCYFPGTLIHHHRKRFERKFGTIIRHKEWWKKEGDQFKLSRSIIPNRASSRKVKLELRMKRLLEDIIDKKFDNKVSLFKIWHEKDVKY